MKSFSERNQARIGLISVAVIVLGMVFLFNLTQFAFLTGATTYKAAFADAAGLQKGDKVRMAGAPVGKVRSIGLDGNKVVVRFDITADVDLGQSTSAAIKTATALGRKFLQVTSSGTGRLDPGTEIPLARTTTPYIITDQLGELTARSNRIDVDQLAESMDVLATAFKDSPPQLRDAVKGLTRFSKTISTRDEAILGLLNRAEGVTGVLADRNQQLTRLVVDGNTLLRELETRRAVIQQLIGHVSAVSRQLSGLVRENEAEVGQTLAQFNSVLDVLKRNEADIAVALQRVGPFATSLGEAVASGPFFMAYVQNLIPGNLIPLPDVVGSSEKQGGAK